MAAKCGCCCLKSIISVIVVIAIVVVTIVAAVNSVTFATLGITEIGGISLGEYANKPIKSVLDDVKKAFNQKESDVVSSDELIKSDVVGAEFADEFGMTEGSGSAVFVVDGLSGEASETALTSAGALLVNPIYVKDGTETEINASPELFAYVFNSFIDDTRNGISYGEIGDEIGQLGDIVNGVDVDVISQDIVKFDGTDGIGIRTVVKLDVSGAIDEALSSEEVPVPPFVKGIIQNAISAILGNGNVFFDVTTPVKVDENGVLVYDQENKARGDLSFAGLDEATEDIIMSFICLGIGENGASEEGGMTKGDIVGTVNELVSGIFGAISFNMGGIDAENPVIYGASGAPEAFRINARTTQLLGSEN